ncbi:RNB domain-containing ribonuclease [Cellulomonas composti]|uniref:Ribonuclease R n=1 Tax=Cellulomonas composti TaxID=266130 RepID=A0A511JBP7_9CELL|nr:RNB domain-containing ribonuclease [Cellulomonas composti]GEL95410.1 ribonuclease R [Cellulomonas composti]
MPRRQVRLRSDDRAVDTAVRDGLAALRAELAIPDEFPPPVSDEARRVAEADPHAGDDRRDARDLPLLTIDPEGSRDLDQALHLERRGDGFRVHYAIADVAAWVVPGRAIDDEARRRVTTLYAPDRRTPLHPPRLSEGAASLLPGQDAPALLWQIDLDGDGMPQAVHVGRAMVRSDRRLSYEQAQGLVDGSRDGGEPDGPLGLLRTVGLLRQAAERERGGITLPTPEQVVERRDGAWVLASRSTLPVEEWNAQISLLTGISAARLMLDARVGILRTLPAADDRDVARLRRAALALGVDWPVGTDVGDVLRGLDAARPAHAAVLTEATTLLRGAAYAAFDGAPPEHPGHGAIAAPYAHVTAPLRRLVDRFAEEVCVAVSAGSDPADWVRAALPDLPARMAEGDRRASAYERGCLDLVEAAVLAGRQGEVFRGAVVDVRDDGATGVVQLREPVVRARVGGAGLPLGEEVDVRLAEVDVARRLVRFEVA